MISIKTDDEIKQMAHAGKILAQTLKNLQKHAKPGVSTFVLEKIAQKQIFNSGAEPAFKGFGGYPYATCISINDEIVHGLPSKNKIIKTGDIIGIDCGVKYNGWNTDAAITFGVGKISSEAKRLLSVTQETLSIAIKLVKPGASLKYIQSRIQENILKNKFGIVRTLTGHGIGRDLQEKPTITNYVSSEYPEVILRKGMTICIEPMVTLGGEEVYTKNDGWTIATKDKSLSAQFEHTIVVTKNGAKVLTKI